MTNEERKVFELALEALESCDAAHITDGGRQWYDERLVDKAIDAIEEALAQMAADVIRESTPPQRKPLTDEQIDKAMAENKQTLIDAADNYWNLCRVYARVIESAHGIKE